MRLSFSTRGWQHLSWDELLEAAVDADLEGVEVYDLFKRPDLIQQLFSGKVPAYSALERNGHSSGYKGAKSDNNQNNRNDDRRGYANNRNDNRKPGYGNNRRDEGNRHFNDNGRGNFGRDRNGRRR